MINSGAFKLFVSSYLVVVQLLRDSDSKKRRLEQFYGTTNERSPTEDRFLSFQQRQRSRFVLCKRDSNAMRRLLFNRIL